MTRQRDRPGKANKIIWETRPLLPCVCSSVLGGRRPPPPAVATAADPRGPMAQRVRAARRLRRDTALGTIADTPCSCLQGAPPKLLGAAEWSNGLLDALTSVKGSNRVGQAWTASDWLALVVAGLSLQHTRTSGERSQQPRRPALSSTGAAAIVNSCGA